MKPDVIVIGGGIGGLACAVELAERGQRVVVLEQSDALGGRARSCTDSTTGDRVDIGPHILLSEYRNMLRLLDQLGTRDRVVWQRGKFLTLVDQPHPVSIRFHRLPAPLHFTFSLLGVPQVSQRDLLSNARLIWFVLRMSRQDVLRIDRISAEDFLHRMGVSERFIDWSWRTAAMSIMNVPLERCSAGALLAFYRYMVGISGYRVGFAAEGLGDLFTGPAARRIEAAGSRVVTGARVVALAGSDRAVTGVRLADGTRIDATACVAAVPPQDLLPLVPESWKRAHAVFRQLAEFEPSAYISSYLWFDRKLTRECFWAKVWSPETLNYDFYDLSNIRHGWHDRPSVIASNIMYSRRADGLDDGQIIEATVRELAAFAPEAAHSVVRHARVHRIPMGIPAPYPGSERLRPDTQAPITGLFFAGDWVRTGLPASMESAVRGGWLAAEQVLAAQGRWRRIALPLPALERPLRWLSPSH